MVTCSLTQYEESETLAIGIAFSDHPERSAIEGLAGDRLSHNGLASGVGLEDTLSFALMELIERDAAAIWWNNRLSLPCLALPESVQQLAVEEGGNGWLLQAFDITADICIPVFAACLVSDSHTLVGLGCSPRAESALEKAVDEVYRSRKVLEDSLCVSEAASTDDINRWTGDALSSLTIPIEKRRCADHAMEDTSGVHKEPLLESLVNAVSARGLEIYAADLTRNECVVATARVIVPGLRTIKETYAPGRLFDVPVALGWLTEVDAVLIVFSEIIFVAAVPDVLT